MYDPKPTVGRIVIYHHNTGVDVPAVVVTVDPSDPDILGLHVMLPPKVVTTPKGKMAEGECCFHAFEVRKGDGATQWGWPPRVQ